MHRQLEEMVLRSGATESWRLKVVLVGAFRAGETSLTRGLVEGEPRLCRDDDRTKGVNVHVSTPVKAGANTKLQMLFWGFAGHSD